MTPTIKKFKYHILIFVLFVISRLPQLGNDNFNTDVWKWKSRSYDFGTGIFTLQFEKTLQKYHPGVTLMWIGALGVKIQNLILDKNPNIGVVDSIFLLDKIQKTISVLFIAVILVFIFHAIQSLVGLRIGLLSVFLISFEPYFVGLTRVFHLEGMLSVLMLACVLWLLYYLQDATKLSRLYLSAFFAGLSLLTKTSALVLIPFGFIALLYTGHKRNAVVWIFLAFLTCFIFWPALWVDFFGVLQALYKGIFVVGLDTDHYQFYFGKYVDSPGHLYYLVVLFLRFSPILIVSLLGAAIIFKKLDSKEKRFLSGLFIYAIVYLLEITIPTKKLDRYILPTIVAFCVIAAVFINYLLYHVTRFVKFIILGVLVLFQLGTLFYIHPDYFSYYSPLFGGLSTGIKVIEPKWMIGTPEIMSYFNKLMTDKHYLYSDENQSFEKVSGSLNYRNVLSVGFQEKYYTQIWPFFRKIGAWAVIQDLSPFAVKTNYFVYPVWDDSGLQENRFNIKKIDTIKIKGVPAYNVYERIW